MATPHSRYFPRCDSVKMTTECLILFFCITVVVVVDVCWISQCLAYSSFVSTTTTRSISSLTTYTRMCCVHVHECLLQGIRSLIHFQKNIKGTIETLGSSQNMYTSIKCAHVAPFAFANNSVFFFLLPFFFKSSWCSLCFSHCIRFAVHVGVSFDIFSCVYSERSNSRNTGNL